MNKAEKDQDSEEVKMAVQKNLEIMSKLKVGLSAIEKFEDDEEYSKGEFTTDVEERRYRYHESGKEVEKGCKRRKQFVKREERKYGKTKLWSTDPKERKRLMAKQVKDDAKVKTAEEREKKVKEKKEKKGKEKKEKTARGKKFRSSSVVDGKITLIEKTNPKREGSKAHKRYELYRKHKTIASYLEAGGKRSSLKYDEKHGYIKLTGVETKADQKK